MFLKGRPWISEQFLPSIERLWSLEIEPTFTVYPSVNDDQIAAFNEEFGIELPEDFRRFYGESDGVDFDWHLGRESGSFSIPSLYELRLFRQRWMNGGMPDRSQLKHPAPDKAIILLEQMRNWLPFEDSFGGDLMCVDCATGRIVMFDHETIADDGRNGTVYGANLAVYIRNCGRLCFPNVWCAGLRYQRVDGVKWVDWTSSNVPARFSIRDEDEI